VLNRYHSIAIREQAFLACSLLLFCALLAGGCASTSPPPATRPVARGVVTPDSLSRLGTTALEARDYQGALEYFRDALEADPHDSASLRGLVALSLATGDATSAVAYGETNAESGDDVRPQDYVDLVRALRDAGQSQGARVRLEQGVDRFPESAVLQGELGLVLLDDHPAEAEPHLKKALAVGPSGETRVVLKKWAEHLFSAGDYRAARPLLEKYDRRYPGDFDVNMSLAFIYGEDGSPKRALPHYRASVSARPKSVDARVSLARTLEKVGRTDSAIREYEKAIAVSGMSPQIEPVLIAQANLLNKKGEYARVLDLIDKAGAAFPQTPGLSCARGMALGGQGRYDEAIRAFSAAMSDRKWGPFAAAQIDRIRSLRSAH
jgi:tetratricopeptide (TPR) repeat protein